MKEQLTAILKLALEYNAAIIAHASLIANQELREKDYQKSHKWFIDTGKKYSKDLEFILTDGNPARTMDVPKHFDLTHFRGITIGDRKFVYCPVGNICSWSEADYDNEWCEWCKKLFREILS